MADETTTTTTTTTTPNADALVTTVGDAVNKIVAEFKADKADGTITLSEAVKLLEDAVGAACLAIKPLLAAGQDVGGLLTAVLMDVYTKEIRPMELQHFGALVSTAVIDPMVHQAIPMLVASAQKLILSL